MIVLYDEIVGKIISYINKPDNRVSASIIIMICVISLL